MGRSIVLYIAFLLILNGNCTVLNSQERNDTIDDYIEGLSDSAKVVALYNTALSHQYTSLSMALHYADKRLEIANKLEDPALHASTYNLYGNLYLESGLYSNAEKYYKMAYDIYYSIESLEGLATECHNLGLVYFIRGDTINSLNFYKESVSVRKKSGNNRRIGDGLTTLGEAYLSINDLDNSIICLYEAIDFYGDTIAYPRKMDCYAFIADNLIYRYPYQALPWLRKLEEDNAVLKSKRYSQIINLRYASYYLAIGNLGESLRSINRINRDSIIIDDDTSPVKIFLALSDKLFEIGDITRGLEFSKTAREVHKKRESHLTADMTSEFKTRLNLRIADEELVVINELNKLTLQQIKIEEYLKYIMIFAVAIISIFGLSFLINFLYLRHAHLMLKKGKLEMETAHDRLIKYKESILKTRDNKNVFFTMISGKLNHPFIELTGELDNLTRLTTKSIVKERFIKKLKEILANGTNIEKSLKRVLLWSKLQRNKYEVQKTEININDYLHEMLPEILGMTIRKDIRVRFDIDHDLSINFDRHSLKTIIRILIENCVDNSEPKSDMIIRGQSVRSGSIISVTDFGRGIPGWLQTTIFDIDRYSGKSEETSKLGIGLLIAKHLAEINDSYISFESNQKKGTTFFLHITN